MFERLTQKLKMARVLLATDVDETLTHKQDNAVYLNQGATDFLGVHHARIPYTTPLPAEAQLNIFSTGRTLEVTLNWQAELGHALNEIHAPDVLLCNNGQVAYLNVHNAPTWARFMQDLQNPSLRQAMPFHAYDRALLEDYTHDVEEFQRLPLSGVLREQLLRHYHRFFELLALNKTRIEGLNLLAVEAFHQGEDPAGDAAALGFESMIKTMRDQQQMEITHGFHLPVLLEIKEDTEASASFYVEHLIVVFFGEGDPKPLIQSMGLSPYSDAQEPSTYLWRDSLAAWDAQTSQTSRDFPLEILVPQNRRSTLDNSTVDALSVLVDVLKQEAMKAFQPYQDRYSAQGLSISAGTQTKNRHSPIARQKSDSPRSYILIHGFLDKGESLRYLYDALIDLSLALKVSTPEKSWDQQLEGLITLGDGGVDQAMLSLNTLTAMHHLEAKALVNHATVVRCGGAGLPPEESRLWSKVQRMNPNVRYAGGFYPFFQ